jgi:uncharacterized protein (TIGR03000 family)
VGQTASPAGFSSGGVVFASSSGGGGGSSLTVAGGPIQLGQSARRTRQAARAAIGSSGWWWNAQGGYWWNPGAGSSSGGVFVQNNYFYYGSTDTGADYGSPGVGAGTGLAGSVPGYGVPPETDEAPPDENPVAEPAAATVELILPDAEALVWFNGKRMTATGEVRTFTTPRLAPGRDFTYDLVVAWREGGKLVSHRRTVAVSAGGTTLVDFTRPATAPPGQPKVEELPAP